MNKVILLGRLTKDCNTNIKVSIFTNFDGDQTATPKKQPTWR